MTELNSSEEESTATDSDEDGLSTINTDELVRSLIHGASLRFPSRSFSSLPEPSAFLHANVLADTGAFSGFLSGLRVSLSQSKKVKQIVPPLTSSTDDGCAFTGTFRSLQDYPAELTNLVSLVLQTSLKQAIVDLFLDTMVECCEEASTSGDAGSTESGGAHLSETSSSSGSDENCESDKTVSVEGLGVISLTETGGEIDFHKVTFY
jgi:hypothetical protein